MARPRSGFTLLELMLIVAIIGVLAAIAIPKYAQMVLKGYEGATKGNLGALRSALTIYYADNERVYPSDDLSSLTSGQRYMPLIPLVQTRRYHGDYAQVTPETSPTDTGQWSYNNVPSDNGWGEVHVGCTHEDLRNSVWSTY